MIERRHTSWLRSGLVAFRGSCPSCEEHSIFEGVYAIRSRCPSCQLDLVGQHGAHYGGPIALGYGIGGLAGLGTFALLFSRFGFQPWVVWTTVGAVVAAILLSFRFCKAWWTWWLYRAGELKGGRH